MRFYVKCIVIAISDALHLIMVYTTVVGIDGDGSTEETKKLIDRYAEKMPVPVIWVWHEDRDGTPYSTIHTSSVPASPFRPAGTREDTRHTSRLHHAAGNPSSPHLRARPREL